MLMRESRALSRISHSAKDSGNQHASPLIRKCRSELARLKRSVNRARNRRAHRLEYRLIKTQALDLASRAKAYLAPEPTDWYSHETEPFKVQPQLYKCGSSSSDDMCSLNSEATEYRQSVLNEKYLTHLKIASLNCRGLSSISKRERAVHLMIKSKIDILCLQETKINHNAVETHQKHSFYWSSDIPDEARKKHQNSRDQGRPHELTQTTDRSSEPLLNI